MEQVTCAYAAVLLLRLFTLLRNQRARRARCRILGVLFGRYSSTTITTRRFLDRPSDVLLVSTGAVSP